jgi:hypothetical protein
MTDREFIEHTLQWLKLSAEVAPFVQKRVVIDSIERYLGGARGERRQLPDRNHDAFGNEVRVPPAGVVQEWCRHGVLKGPATVCLQCADPAFHAASRNNPTPYQTFTLTGETQQASALNQSLCAICGEPNFSIPRLGIGHVCKLKPNATYWRCIHHPSLIENMKDHRYVCEHGCHKSELRWYDNGTCKPQTS